MNVQVLKPGLWRWTASHPEWDHAEHWGPEVASVYAELPDAVVLVDPLVPADGEERFWSELDRDIERAGRPVYVVLTVHWHERSVETVLARYPEAKLWRPEESVDLPAGAEPIVVEGSDWKEAMLFLEPHRALVTGDLLIGTNGGVELPIQWFPTSEQDWVREQLKPMLRERLARLPVELVLTSHGEPVLTDAAAALAQALEM
jgi:glyoxylase-like metal-dependent hydrolase (beta-lactamase superfamily II)